MTLDELTQHFISSQRIARFREIASQRLGCLTVVFDNCGEPHNENACIRVADSFGVGTVYHYHPRPYRKNSQISMHADRWVNVRSFACLENLKTELRSSDFCLVGTVVPGDGGTSYADLALPPKTALVIGGERHGMSPAMRQLCDILVTIPTFGFVDSLNLSTATAIILQHFSWKYRQQGGNVFLSREEQEQLLWSWIEKDLRKKLRRQGMEHLLEDAGG